MADDLADTLTLEDFGMAIASLRIGLESMSRDDPDFNSTATLLAHAPRKHYLLSRPNGVLNALDESITFLHQALNGTSVDDPRRPEWLISLSFGLSLRCDATDSESDAREASQTAYEAVGAAEKDDSPYATILRSPCHFIGKKAIRLPKEDDLEKLFEMHKSITSAMTVYHPKLRSRLRLGRAVRLSNLGGVYAEAYGKTGNTERFEEAIRIGRDTLAATPDSHPDKDLRHFNLAQT